MAVGFLDITDERVQEFLWEHIVPADIACDYTKADAFKFIYEQVMRGSQWLVGDLDRRVMFRIFVCNPKVIEPHIMGSAVHMRTVFAEALPLAWERGVEKVMIWTQHKPIVAIFEHLGFEVEGHFKRMHMVNGELLDLTVLSLEKPK